MKYFLLLLSFSFQLAMAQENPDVQPEAEILKAETAIKNEFAEAFDPNIFSNGENKQVLQGYNKIDPQNYIPDILLKEALLYFDANKSKFPNQNYITIVDFSPRSDKYRFFLIDMKSGKVQRLHTTHGTGSDVDDDGFAESFGNESGSNKSSLGYVRTGEVYSGSFGPSVRLDGLSSSNSNMRRRAVVFHGWAGIREANVKPMRSWGCITLDYKVKDTVLEKIKDGSFMYVGVSKP